MTALLSCLVLAFEARHKLIPAPGDPSWPDELLVTLCRWHRVMMRPPVQKPPTDAKSDGNGASPHVGPYARCCMCTTTRDGSELAPNERKGGASAATRSSCGRCAGAIICGICACPTGHRRSCKAIWRGTPQVDSTMSDTRVAAPRKSLPRDRERVLSPNRRYVFRCARAGVPVRVPLSDYNTWLARSWILF